MNRERGKVFLVGAGPGDPGLITKRGWDYLSSADVIVVDGLVNPELLKINRSARIVYVGKRGPGAPMGASFRLPQSGINQLLVSLAKQGNRVVRLKGGDPLIFGRGGEEIEYLYKSGISYEVVPGVSSAIAAPAYAGIPLSDRRWASQITFLTGQESSGAKSSFIDWARLSPHGTLVILMGVSSWPMIQEKLVLFGWPKNTPIAAIECGTTYDQRTLRCTLGAAASFFRSKNLVSPTIIVVGRVAALGDKRDWFRKEKPLLGCRVVVTRSESQNSKMIQNLEEKGASVTRCPAIATAPVDQDSMTRVIVNNLKNGSTKYDWIIFLSENAVRAFSSLMNGNSWMKKTKFCAVGPQTAAAMREEGWRVHKVAKIFNSKGVASALGAVRGKRILIPRVQGASRDLVNYFSKNRAVVQEIETYQTVAAPPPLPLVRQEILRGVDAITFTSASTVRYFLSFFSKKEQKKIFSKAIALSIGSHTSQILRRFKIKSIVESPISEVCSMIETLCLWYEKVCLKSRKPPIFRGQQ